MQPIFQTPASSFNPVANPGICHCASPHHALQHADSRADPDSQRGWSRNCAAIKFEINARISSSCFRTRVAGAYLVAGDGMRNAISWTGHADIVGSVRQCRRIFSRWLDSCDLRSLVRSRDSAIHSRRNGAGCQRLFVCAQLAPIAS